MTERKQATVTMMDEEQERKERAFQISQDYQRSKVDGVRAGTEEEVIACVLGTTPFDPNDRGC